jgi:NitT/TauT family transport system ATP-binding protein
MIDIKDLEFAYSGHAPLFKGFNLKIKRGESWSVIGSSGCGKTTLLYLLAGLRKRNSGQINIDGMPIMRPRPQTGLVLQDHGLLPWATVKENARLGLRIRDFYGPDGRHAPFHMPGDPSGEKDLDYWLERLGIYEFKDKYPYHLSRGQRQRAAIARTLVLSPDLLLMDEPFSALDVGIRQDLQQTMKGLHVERNLTNVLVTHDIEEAVFNGEYILVLKGVSNSESLIIKNESAGVIDGPGKPGHGKLCEELAGLLGRRK